MLKTSEKINANQRRLHLQNSIDSLKWDTSLTMSNEHYGGIVEERKPEISEAPLWEQIDRRLTLCFKHIYTRTQKRIIGDS